LKGQPLTVSLWPARRAAMEAVQPKTLAVAGAE
jgi:hypothetical protein